MTMSKVEVTAHISLYLAGLLLIVGFGIFEAQLLQYLDIGVKLYLFLSVFLFAFVSMVTFDCLILWVTQLLIFIAYPILRYVSLNFSYIILGVTFMIFVVVHIHWLHVMRDENQYKIENYCKELYKIWIILFSYDFSEALFYLIKDFIDSCRVKFK